MPDNRYALAALAVTIMATNFDLTSPAFKHQDPIPSQYTCDGLNVSPPLRWTPPPAGTESLFLLMDDPDAPHGTWTHWLLYNLSPTARELREGVSKEAALPDGSMQGTTDFQEAGYGGPCPPSGTHRYLFKLYALDAKLPVRAGAGRPDLEKAMRGHVVGQALLIGAYQRKKK